MKLCWIIESRWQKIEASRISEPDQHHGLVGRGDPARDERIRRVHRGYALKIDVIASTLRN
jgi:hypothetical protein